MGHVSKLFHGSENSLYSRITPSDEQREFLQTQWNALADYLKPKLAEIAGLPVSTWLQGSYKFGTLLKPVHLNEEYDVDVGVYFEWDSKHRATPAPRQLRDWVQASMLDYGRLTADIKVVVDPAKERCSRAIYVRRFHIDTPVYHLDVDRDQRRLACQSNKWEGNDPKAIYRWFKTSVPDSEREQLRRIVRYLKAWAAVSFDKDSPSRPSSIFLTVLAAQLYKKFQFWKVGSTPDDDVLTSIIKGLYDRLTGDRRVTNPVDDSEDLNRMDEQGWDGFLPKLRALHECACSAETAEDEITAALTWSQAFSYLMPLPEAEALEIIEEGAGTLMALPDIDIEVYRKNPRSLVARHRNEVPSVAKNRDLVFKIVNPHILPPFATIEWTVRNGGLEADGIGDLGHRQIGTLQLTAEERTSYTGRHFMDCVVRSHGHVYALRRVPVHINDVPNAMRNPPKPSYTRIQSIRRRRR